MAPVAYNTNQLSRDKALATLNKVGSVKASEETHILKAHNLVLDTMARATMRNPSVGGVRLLSKTKDKLRQFFADKSNEEIEWIFSHGKESRGFFKDYKDDASGMTSQKAGLDAWLAKKGPADANHSDEELADILAHQTEEEKTASMDISLINGILASITYAGWDSNLTYIKKGEDGKEISRTDCTQAKSDCLRLKSQSPSVPNYLGERGKAIVKIDKAEIRLNQEQELQDVLPNPEEQKNKSAALKRIQSMASMPSLEQFLKPVAEIAATRRVFDTQTPYAKIAAERGRLVGHYSANTPSALFMLNELFKAYPDDPNSVKECELSAEDAEIFAGLIAAEYHRSGFHAPEEVYLALQPYLIKVALEEANAQHNKPPISKAELEAYLKQVIPGLLPDTHQKFIVLTQQALLMMANASLDSPKLAIKAAITQLAEEIAHHPRLEMSAAQQTTQHYKQAYHQETGRLNQSENNLDDEEPSPKI